MQFIHMNEIENIFYFNNNNNMKTFNSIENKQIITIKNKNKND